MFPLRLGFVKNSEILQSLAERAAQMAKEGLGVKEVAAKPWRGRRIARIYHAGRSWLYRQSGDPRAVIRFEIQITIHSAAKSASRRILHILQKSAEANAMKEAEAMA